MKLVTQTSFSEKVAVLKNCLLVKSSSSENVAGREKYLLRKSAFENLPISSSSYENNMLKISH